MLNAIIAIGYNEKIVVSIYRRDRRHPGIEDSFVSIGYKRLIILYVINQYSYYHYDNVILYGKHQLRKLKLKCGLTNGFLTIFVSLRLSHKLNPE